MDDQSTTPSTPASAPHGRKMVFALRNGALAHIRDVPNGKACGCICPACGAPLEAVNGGRKRIHHFRHAAGSNCAAGYETALHLAGKEALMRLRRVMLPEHRRTLRRSASDGKVFEQEVHFPARMIKASEAWEEQWLDGFRPDVLFVSDGHRLIIEVKVTHAVDEEKRGKIRNKGISAMEIDLSGLSAELLQQPSEFERYVISELKARRWVFSRRLELAIDNARERLQKQADAYEAWLASREQKRQQRASTWREKRAEARSELEADLQQLNLSHDSDRATAREKRLASRNLVPSVSRYLAMDDLRLFARVKWGWAFKASSDQWQACVLDLLFPGGTGEPQALSAERIEKHLLSTLGVPGFILRLKHQVYLDCRCKPGGVLTIEETACIPKLNVPIEQYLMHLTILGLITQAAPSERLSTCYLPRGRTIQEAREAHARAVAESERWRAEQEAQAKRLEEDLKREAERQRAQNVLQESQRIMAIRASELFVFEEHGGHAMRCQRCMLVSAKGSQLCPYCGSADLLDTPNIDAHRISKNRFMLATSAGVARSIGSASELDISMLQSYIDQLAAEPGLLRPQ